MALERYESRDNTNIASASSLSGVSSYHTPRSNTTTRQATSSPAARPSPPQQPYSATPLPDSTSLKTFPSSSITTLFASKTRTPLYIHTALLTSVSPFFRAALSPTYNFREARENSMTLGEEDVKTVEWFILWVYTWATDDKAGESHGRGDTALWHERLDNRVLDTYAWRVERDQVRDQERRAREAASKREAEEAKARRLGRSTRQQPHTSRGQSNPSNAAAARVSSITTSNSSYPEGPFRLPRRPEPPCFMPILKLYIFADKYGIPHLRNRICAKVRIVACEANTFPNLQDITLIWENTLPYMTGDAEEGPNWRMNPMRQLILDLWRPGFGRKLINEMRRLGTLPPPREEKPEGEHVIQDFWRDLVLELLAERDEEDRREGGKKECEGERDAEKDMIVIGRGRYRIRRPRDFYDE